MTEFINWNGNVVEKTNFSITPDNRGFRYGDGFFETMKVHDFRIDLAALHFERFFYSLKLLQFDIPPYYDAPYFTSQIELLLRTSGHSGATRVRLMVYRGDGGLYQPFDNAPNFVIQSWPLNPGPQQQLKEISRIDIFEDSRKACDMFSSIKSNNYLGYLMAALFVQKQGIDEAIILNTYGRICDATIANVFIISDGVVKTPPLSEGCVSGVYRKFLLQSFLRDDIKFEEAALTVEDLLSASEVFLTNAITGIKSVQQCRETVYSNELSRYLHNRYSIIL